jgi:threonine dehydrogenase-like Zn-dependent dehydrogenase
MTDWAIQITAPQRAELVKITRPEGPLGPLDVCGRTLATAVSPGTELASAYLLDGGFPRGLGYAAVMEVEQVGAEVQDLEPGQRVFCVAGHRSFHRLPASEVVPVPEGLDPCVAVFCRLMGVTMSTLVTTTARPPDMVLVTGLGIIGNLGAQVFQHCGYDVIACDPMQARRTLAEAAGIRTVLPAAPLDAPQICGQVSLVLECSGHEAAALDGCRMVRQRGEVVLVGVPWRRNTDLTAHELLDAVFHKYAVLRSGWEWEVPRHPAPYQTGSLFGNYAAALDWLARGQVRVSGLYETASPHDAQRVYQGLLKGTWPALTAVFDWKRV